MKWWQYLFGRNERLIEFNKQLAEIRQKQERVNAAFALHRDVLHNYGLEAYAKLRDVDSIIQDNKPITVINYLDI